MAKKRKHKCETCGKRFNSEKALAQHTQALHEKTEEDTPVLPDKKVRKIKTWSIIVLVIVAIFGGSYLLIQKSAQACLETPATETNIGSHSNINFHIHPTVSIRINGQPVTIPPNIGISSSYMRPVHTHDSSGEIHVEGVCIRDYTLGEFFDVWGRQFNNECIFEYCNDENHSLSVMVDGQPVSDYRDVVLRDHTNIEIVYE